MKTAVIVYSLSGNNQVLANYLQQRFIGDLFVVDCNKKKSALSVFLDVALNRTPKIDAAFHVGQYDHYVFVAPVWAGRIASPMKAFLKREAANINDNYSFATICGGGANEQEEKIKQELSLLTGHLPVSFLDLWVTKIVKADKTDRSKLVAAYRIDDDDLVMFREEIDRFVNEVEIKEHEVLQHSH